MRGGWADHHSALSGRSAELQQRDFAVGERGKGEWSEGEGDCAGVVEGDDLNFQTSYAGRGRHPEVLRRIWPVRQVG